MPLTLVHGDFVAKNLRVRNSQEGPILLPLDWETAGWGVPAADLAQVVGRAARPDLATYWSIVRESSWELDLPTLQRLADLGVVFRVLAAIRWTSEALPYRWLHMPMLDMRSYDDRLRVVMQATNWKG
jgi:aminoglycoside phosphotransferase (APT) family kinase protein